MITLYSYPRLYGVADNNGYGLKVYAFLRLAGVSFRQEHVFDASSAPRGQLPYIVEDGETIGDSETIIDHLVQKHGLTIDNALTKSQRYQDLLVTRMLDDLYWVMYYSRWQDGRYWPAFRDALLREHPSLRPEDLLKAREFNFQRYYYQGIGRYPPEMAYARGLADLSALASLILRRATRTDRRRPALTRPSTDLSPTFIFTTSTRRSSSLSFRSQTSSDIASPFMAPCRAAECRNVAGEHRRRQHPCKTRRIGDRRGHSEGAS